MPKNQSTFTIKGKLDIRDITSGLDTVKSTVQSMDLGTGLTADILKDINAIQKKMNTAFSKLPGAKATSKQVETFSLKMEDATADLNLLIEKLKNFGASDKYIKENIASIQQFANEITKASKKTADARAEIDKVDFKGSAKFAEEGHFKTRHKELTGKMRTAARQGETANLTDNYNTLKNELQSRIDSSIQKNDPARAQALTQAMDALKIEYKELLPYSEQVSQSFKQQTQAQEDYAKAFKESTDTVNLGAQQVAKELEPIAQGAKQTAKEAHEMNEELQKTEETNKVFESLQRRVKSFFSVTSVFYSVRRVVRGAIQDFKELDKQFNEIAIVSDYSTKEMWESFSSVNKVAQEFGVETKNVLEVQNLYYHQGKSMAEVNKLTAQTLTLAKITGMDYEKATSDLTAALNAYNIAAEDAVRVTDTIAAMDTNAAISSQELMTALTKTASIAANAGMSLESTEVFLTKMIETTREAPENLGTALKTIIARFGEVKQEVDGEEIELADINRVDTALKSIGISLLDTAGQIRDLDGVFMELSSKWDDLDRNTQRYIATIAAGSRQQSRFIAMMEDYDRTLELTEIAQNSAGLGARQLAKSQESIETSVNRLKSTWQGFYSSLITSGMIKGVLELGNTLLSLVNTLNDTSPLLGTIVAALAIWAIKTQIVDKGIKKLGQVLGEGIGQSSIFEKVIISLVGAMDKQTRKAVLASGALNKYADALARANLAGTSNKTPKETPKGKLKVTPKVAPKESSVKSVFKDNIDDMAGKVGKKTKGIKLSGKGSYNLNNLGKISNSITGLSGKANGIKGTLKGIGNAFSKMFPKVAGTLGKVIGVLKGIVTFLGGPLSIALGAVTATLLIGIAAWKKYGKASLDDTKKIEKLQKAQEEYNTTVKEYGELKEKIKKIEEYSSKNNLSTEQLQEQQELVKELVGEYPELLNYIDEEGNYHLKNAEAIQKVINAKKELLSQEAADYTELRLKYAEEGIYADTSTQAGKTMQTIQEYSSSLDEDSIKDTAKKIDSYTGFNSSQYKKMMKAFAEGKKFSFDEKDMSNLFEGNISNSNWKEFLQAVKDNPMILETEKDLSDALKATKAYNMFDADQVAKAFIKMNNENGKLFSQLIEGAAKEYSQIEVSYAEIQIEKGDFATELSSEIKDSISQIAVEQAIEAAGGEEKWKKLDDEKKEERIKHQTNLIIEQFEGKSKSEIQDLNTIFTTKNVGSLKYSQATDIDFSATDQEGKKDAIRKFYGQLSEEMKEQFPEGEIDELEDEIINTLFNLISSAVEGTNIEDIKNNIVSDYLKSSSMYNNVFEDILSKSSEVDDLTVDQWSALANKTGDMSIESIAPYLQQIIGLYSNRGEDRSELFNNLIKSDFTSISGIASAQADLRKFGFTAEEVAQIAVNAMNGIDNITIDNFDTTIDDAKKSIEKLTTGLGDVGALIEGTASAEQLGSYMNTMMSVWTEAYGAEKASSMLNDLNNNIIATGDGFKIGTEDGLEYADSLTNIAKEAVITKIALLELALQEGNLSEEEKANTQATITYLKQYYSYIDAQQKKTFQNKLIKDLEEAKEKADKFVDAMKAYVDWLRGFDKYQNINEILETLGQDFENLEFEIGFSTNTDVIEQDIEKTISNLNTQIAANQGKRNAAQSEMAMWRDTITKRNSDYVSFDAEGNAIVNAERLQHLQEEIKNASEERKPVLQAEYDEIIANVEAYNKEKDVVNETTKNLQDNFKALEDFLKAQYDSIMKVEDKLIEARMAAEDKELDAVKEKYDAIKEENDKYLESVQDMIDEERRIRDQAEKEEDVRNKEKKLAMMKMDTSGIYSSDIRSLEKELENDYRELEDTAVDKAIEEMNKTFETQAEIFDKEIEYLENSLEYKRETMTEYNQWAQEMMMQGSDTVLAYLKANDEEYYTGTAAAQANWILEWNNSVTQGIAANNQMGTSLQEVFNNLEACKDNAYGFEGAIIEYGSTAMATNGEIESTVNDLSGYYQTLVSKVEDLDFALDGLARAYEDAASAARNLKAAQDGGIIGTGPDPNDIQNTANEYNGLDNSRSGIYISSVGTGSYEYYADENENAQIRLSGDLLPYWKSSRQVTGQESENFYVKSFLKNGEEFYVSPDEQAVSFVHVSKHKSSQYKILKNKFGGMLDGRYYWKSGTWQTYATGGYVDYTGPAWVDGTKSRPEYMLNATQTQQFETLVTALSSMFSNGSTTPISQSNQKIGDTQYNFHINVEQMANDYDVDQLLARLEKKIQSTSKYRQVTYLNKSNT